jgi:uncharacterized protein
MGMIHCFSVLGQKMVLDVESGSLHKIDDAAYAVLSQAQSMDDVRALCDDHDLLEEITDLANAGQLFAKANENAAKAGLVGREPVVKALCLHMAHACNLQCRYCFAGQGAYGGDTGLMSAQTAKKAIDFLIKHSGARRNLEIDFFGGEPMLNLDAVKETVAYGRKREKQAGKCFRFTLTTNATLLEASHHAYINEQMDNVVLSLDGRPSVHDGMRKQPDGVGGYDDIFDKISALANSRSHERYYVRGTYTRHNPDFAADVLHLADAGFRQISIEPVVAAKEADYALRPQDVPILCNEYEKLTRALLERKRAGKPFRFFHFEIDMDGGPCIAKRVTGCGAGSEYLAITPGGRLYPCHQFVGDESFCLGDLDTGIVNHEWVKKFGACDVYTKPACQQCWARYYCSGGCMAHAYQSNGDIQTPDKVACDLQRKRIECGLWLCGERRD